MSKVLTLNGVKVTDTMIMYAISGSTLYVMLEYLNPLGTSGVLLEVTDYTYANLLTDTEFAQVNRTGGTYLVNPYRVKKIASNVITFDNGMTITTTSTDSDALNTVNDAMVVDGVPYTGATADLDMGSHNVLVVDEAYGAGWDTSLEVPTKNAVYDKIQAIFGGGYTIVSIDFAASPYTVIPITNTTLYQVDCTGGNVILNFPTAIGSTAIWGVKKIDSSLNTITLEPFGAQTIDGNANQTILFQNTQVDIYSDNANLFIK